MNIKIEHIFAITGIELIIAAGLINIITGSWHYFTGASFHSSNGFVFLMGWGAIYGIFAMFYFVFGMIEGRFKEEEK